MSVPSLGDHGESALEGPREPVLVLVDDEEGVHLLHLVAQHVHDLVDELGVVSILGVERFVLDNFNHYKINITFFRESTHSLLT